MIKLTLIVSRSKRKCYKSQKVRKFALNSWLETIQILKNDVLMLILCLSYFITTVTKTSCGNVQKWVSVCNVASHRICDSKEGFSQQKSWMLSIWLLLKSPLNIYIWSLTFIQIIMSKLGKRTKIDQQVRIMSLASFVTHKFLIFQFSFYVKCFYKKCFQTFILVYSF